MKLFSILFLMFALLSAGCSKDEDKKEVGGCTDPKAMNYNPNATMSDGSCVYPLALTQEMLDSVSTPYRLGLTGPHQQDGIYIKNEEFNDSTIRDIYSSALKSGSSLQPGDVVVRKVYRKKPNGERGDLFEITIIHKQPTGYFEEAHDMEFALLEDGSTVSAEHPNGLLPAIGDVNRGKVSECISCHAKGKYSTGGDGLFSR